MNEFITIDRANRTVLAVNLIFLSIHVLLGVLFFLNGVRLMAYYSLFSIVFYLTRFYPIYQHQLRRFVKSAYLEVVVHTTLGLCLLGKGPGYQMALLGVNILLYYAEYVGRRLGQGYVFASPYLVFSFACYLFSSVWSHFYPPYYQLSGAVTLVLQFLWGIISFGVVAVFLRLFVHYASSTEETLSDRVTHDKLTGLPNRYYMNAFLDETRERGYLPSYWAAMADIDNFKKVNDTYGHNCGDYVLKIVAQLLKEGISHAELCRWGGEEFLIVGKARRETLDQIVMLERVRRSVEQYAFRYEDKKLHVTITIGVARYVEGMTLEEWVDMADQKLYKGKCSGKNQVVS